MFSLIENCCLKLTTNGFQKMQSHCQKELGNVVGLGIILMDEESDDKEIEE